MAGFTDNRFLNQTFVKPSAGGGAVPASGFGKAMQFTGNVFNEAAQKARAEDIKEDKRRGVVLGQNSIEVDELGNISRKAMDPSITTKEGQFEFQVKQTNAALVARQNAIRNKSAELAIKYKYHPNSLVEYENDIRAFLEPFLDETNKDIQGRLTVEAEDVISKAIIGLGQIIEDRDQATAVENSKQSANAVLSNIGQAAFLGRNTAGYQNSLKADLDLAVAAGAMRPEERTAYLKSAHISVIAGGMFRDVAGAKNENLYEVERKIRERLFGKPGSKQTPEVDKRFNVDLNNDDKELIMQKVRAQVNFITGNMAQQTNQENLRHSKMIAPIELAVASSSNMSPADLQDLYAGAGITPDMIEDSAFLRQRHLALMTKVQGQNEKALRLGERQHIADLNTGIATATSKNASQAWQKVEDAKANGVFKYYPNAYNVLLGKQATRLNSLATAMKNATEQEFDDWFTKMNHLGQLNEDVLSILMSGTSTDGKKLSRPIVRYLQKNHGKVRGWIKAADGGRSELSAARIALANGLTNNATGRKHADTLIEYDEEEAKRKGDPSPYDMATPAGRAAIFQKVQEHGIAGTKALNVLSNLAFSKDVALAEEGAIAWRGLQGTPQGMKIRNSISAKGVKAELAALDNYFSPTNRNDAESFDKWRLSRTGDLKFAAVREEMEATTLEQVTANMRKTIVDAMVRENVESRASFQTAGLWKAFRLIAPKDQTFSEKFIAKDARGDTAWFNHDVAEFSPYVNRLIHQSYMNERFLYPEGENGKALTNEAVLQEIHEGRLVGPSNYRPLRRIGDDGQYVDQQDDLVHFVARPIEAYFDSPEVVNTLVENAVRHALDQPAISSTPLPPVLNGWIKGALGFEDLMTSGWVRLVPNVRGSTKDQWRGAIVLQDPDDPTRNPIVIASDFQPHIRDYHAIQKQEFSSQ